jgi:hypothetical protein
MGVPPPILHAAEQQRRSILEQRCARVKDAIGRIGPIGRGENGIEWVTVKKLGILIAH